jgi:ABC-2 type transport system ATP-binding protein
MALIRVDRLTKRYGAVTAVDDLSFTVAPAAVTGFVGANGAGKSTTFRMILGLTRPTAGTATVDGRPFAELRNPASVVGALTDPQVFHPRRRGRDALRVHARISGIGDRRVDEVLDLVGLSDAAGRRVGGYSTGMRQRLALALALLGDPGTLLLDEPTSGLDPHGVTWLRGLVRGLAAEGRTVLVSSHGLAELAQTVDDVVVIDRGRLVARGTTAELLSSAGATSLEAAYLNLVGDVSEDDTEGAPR